MTDVLGKKIHLYRYVISDQQVRYIRNHFEGETDEDKLIQYCARIGNDWIENESVRIQFIYQSGFLFIKLPSGRKLAYVKHRIGENQFGGGSVTYEGVGNAKKWERLESYGPKFVENIVQGVARDGIFYNKLESFIESEKLYEVLYTFEMEDK